jgi:hypothetical protein
MKKSRVNRIRVKQTKRKTRGGMCPCMMGSVGQARERKTGGFVGVMMTQFNNAAALLTPIGAALGIKVYRDLKKKRTTRRRK